MVKAEKLRNKYDFDSVLNGGIKVVNPKLILVGRAVASQASARLGLVVSRKVGNAVVRNYVKRCLRASFDALKTDLAGLEIVAIARPWASQASGTELGLALGECAQRLKRRVASLA